MSILCFINPLFGVTSSINGVYNFKAGLNSSIFDSQHCFLRETPSLGNPDSWDSLAKTLMNQLGYWHPGASYFHPFFPKP